MKFNIFVSKEFAFPVIFARIFIDTHFEFGLKNKSAGRLFWHFSFLEFMGGYKRNYVQVSTWMILNSTFRSNYKAIFLAAKNWSNSTDHLHYYSTAQRCILVKSRAVKKCRQAFLTFFFSRVYGGLQKYLPEWSWIVLFAPITRLYF